MLKGKTALVTGSTSGIGLGIAQALAAQGVNIVFNGFGDAAAIDRLQRDVAAEHAVATGYHGADMSKPAEIRDLMAFAASRFGAVDILVNNAGIGIFKPTAELTIEDWRRTIDINLSGSFYCSRAALERMRLAGGGYILNLSSLAGKNPFAGGAAYNASKFGLNGFSEAMMLDHRQEEIRVTYIMPGSVDTNFSPRTGGKGADWKIAPEDVADMVLAVLRMPVRTLVSRVEIRPSKPGK